MEMCMSIIFKFSKDYFHVMSLANIYSLWSAYPRMIVSQISVLGLRLLSLYTLHSKLICSQWIKIALKADEAQTRPPACIFHLGFKMSTLQSNCLLHILTCKSHRDSKPTQNGWCRCIPLLPLQPPACSSCFASENSIFIPHDPCQKPRSLWWLLPLPHLPSN